MSTTRLSQTPLLSGNAVNDSGLFSLVEERMCHMSSRKNRNRLRMFLLFVFFFAVFLATIHFDCETMTHFSCQTTAFCSP